MKKFRVLRWVRELGKWNLYKENEDLFVVRLPQGTTRDFVTKEKAERFMLYEFFKDLEAKH